MHAHQDIATLFAEAEVDIARHALTRRGFQAIYLAASGSESSADAARLLLETLGSERAVKDWVEYHINLTKNVLTTWYITARLEAHETKHQKGKQQ